MRTRTPAFALAAMISISTPLALVGQANGAFALSRRVDAIADSVIRTGPVAGLAIGIRRGSNVVLLEGYGYADIELEVPASAETVYRIGSITKQFTAAAILRLVEQGELSLDDELTDFLPEYPTQGHQVTVHHLLTHTSGIKSYTSLGERWQKNLALEFTPEEMIDLFKDEPFDFAPNERFLYSNSGYFLLGAIIEQVTGRSYADYIEDEFFAPLDMSGSYYCDERRIIPHRAEGYAREDGKLVNDAPIGMTQPYAAGSLCSTVRDLLTWQAALSSGRIVSDDSYRLMITPARLANDSSTGYGYGLAIGRLERHTKISHGGGINGFQSQLAEYPGDSLVVVVLANTEGARPGRIERQIAELILGIEREQPKDLPLSEAEITRLVGTYDLGPLQIRVFERDGKLMAQGTGQPAFQLLYQGDGVFVAVFDPTVRLEFDMEGERAGSLTLIQGGRQTRAARVD